MKSFIEQLTVTRQNLERLEALYAKHPELFEHANLIEITTDGGSIYVHASRDPNRDWLALARKHSAANWKRKRSGACDYSSYDWDGTLDGFRVCILGVESIPEPESLFGERSVAA